MWSQYNLELFQALNQGSTSQTQGVLLARRKPCAYVSAHSIGVAKALLQLGRVPARISRPPHSAAWPPWGPQLYQLCVVGSLTWLCCPTYFNTPTYYVLQPSLPTLAAPNQQQPEGLLGAASPHPSHRNLACLRTSHQRG